MIRQTLLALMVVISMQPFTSFAQQPRSAEQAVESSTALVTLPGAVPATISVTGCAECKAVLLRVTDKTRFFVGKQAVSLKQLRQFISGSATVGLYVFFESTSRTVTRIVVDGQLPQGEPVSSK